MGFRAFLVMDNKVARQEMAENGGKWQEMAGNGRKKVHRGYLVGNGRKWQEMAEKKFTAVIW